MANAYLPYLKLMRLHRPIGILLLLWPTLWALWIAGNGHPDGWLVVIFTAGVCIMRSAGCVMNDLADRGFDGRVMRTKERPLVTGEVSVKGAISLFLVLCVLALGLLWPLNVAARWLAVPAIVLATIYPFMKRYTHLPQLILGIAFSWGVPMAFAAQTGGVSMVGWFMFFIACLWPVAYDTIYAMVDRPDDLQVGVKSTAILLGYWDTTVVAGLHGLMLLLLVVLGIQLAYGVFYYLALVGALGVMLYQQWLIHGRDPKQCFQAFLISQWVGALVFLGVLLG